LRKPVIARAETGASFFHFIKEANFGKKREKEFCKAFSGLKKSVFCSAFPYVFSFSRLALS